MSDDLLRQRNDGAKAKTVVDSEAFQKAYKAVGDAILDAWADCPIRDREGAHELKLLLKLHKDYLGHLRKAVEDGEFAAKELARDKSFTQRLSERLRIA